MVSPLLAAGGGCVAEKLLVAPPATDLWSNMLHFFRLSLNHPPTRSSLLSTTQLAACPTDFAGTFAKTIEDAGKFWADATWHGASVTGAAAPQPAADLHISLRWLTTLPPITEDVRKL